MKVYLQLFLILFPLLLAGQIQEDWTLEYDNPVKAEIGQLLTTDQNQENIYWVVRINDNVGDTDFETLKVTELGKIEWIQTYIGPANFEDRANSLVYDGHLGNIWVAGGTSLIGSVTKPLLIGYDSLGNMLGEYAEAFYAGEGEFYDCSVDEKGKVYSCSNTLTIPDTLGIFNAFSFNQDASLNWKAYSYDLYLKKDEFIKYQDGYVYTLGGRSFSGDSTKVFTYKYDTLGNYIWHKELSTFPEYENENLRTFEVDDQNSLHFIRTLGIITDEKYASLYMSLDENGEVIDSISDLNSDQFGLVDFVDGALYAESKNENGQFYKIDKSNGTVIWESVIPSVLNNQTDTLEILSTQFYKFENQVLVLAFENDFVTSDYMYFTLIDDASGEVLWDSLIYESIYRPKAHIKDHSIYITGQKDWVEGVSVPTAILKKYTILDEFGNTLSLSNSLLAEIDITVTVQNKNIDFSFSTLSQETLLIITDLSGKLVYKTTIDNNATELRVGLSHLPPQLLIWNIGGQTGQVFLR